MEETHFSETSFLTRSTRRHIPEDGTLLTYAVPESEVGPLVAFFFNYKEVK
jgi:hypothetical protein